jgi:hypothetical protein
MRKREKARRGKVEMGVWRGGKKPKKETRERGIEPRAAE